MSVTIEGKTRKNYSLSSSTAKLKLTKLYYDTTGKSLPSNSLTEALNTLKAIALFEGPTCQTFLRVAKHDGKVIINLADSENRIVVIDANVWEVANDSPVHFMESPFMRAMPMPMQGGSFRQLQKLLSVDDVTFSRILAFLINALKPDGPYIFLLVEGEQGSGKSFLCQILKTLIDPSHAPKQRMPESERDLMILAKDNHLLVFDNISGMRGDMSDGLCCLSTGGGFSTRKLYANAGMAGALPTQRRRIEARLPQPRSQTAMAAEEARRWDSALLQLPPTHLAESIQGA
jgi:hypothetical protein